MISKLQYITQGNTPEGHIENLQKACSYGAEWIQLRLKNVDEQTILEIAKEARAITNHFQTRLIINDYYQIAKEVTADGVHLGKKDTCPLVAKKYLGKMYTVGGTANTLEDCKELVKKGVNYIGLGPFRFTETKKDLSPVLGIQGYQLIVEELAKEIPIVAIGGVTLKDVSLLLKTGIHGVAVSSEITQSFSTIPAFHTLLKGGSTMEKVYKFS
ncbi:thiamine-phosphate diphosphorylase [Tenacibaculum sp. MAR_2009_124]|uniref:thiamine phosphate synthase n=1 Tax=Tenacibaculum sp. MAR_2009_124 TaxID=1250059 RepID=UPI000894BB6F|nr:thiamine phosphate synthase [Tenacibaculum sp. MAR_2009_124]SEB79936.1 thiamine-phosphate diphosphorylase [Tenacibaculum sp. MAR_2009_124]